MDKLKPTIGFIGAGVTGTALACQLFSKGYQVVAVHSRTTSSSERLASYVSNCRVCITAQEVADIAQAVFITTPDDIIADIVTNLKWRKDQYVIHCSGVHSADILYSARQNGAHVCCLHPLQTFATLKQAIENISGSTFAIDGDERAVEVARNIAIALNGSIILLNPEDKVLYHAAAVIVSNYLVTLVKIASDVWQSFGIPRDKAIKALLPLLKGTLHNIESAGIPACLTGPIARGDIGTIQKHMNAIKIDHPEALDVYRSLGIQTVEVALSKGRINLETAEEIRASLHGDKQAGAGISVAIYEQLLDACTENGEIMKTTL